MPSLLHQNSSLNRTECRISLSLLYLITSSDVGTLRTAKKMVERILQTHLSSRRASHVHVVSILDGGQSDSASERGDSAKSPTRTLTNINRIASLQSKPFFISPLSSFPVLFPFALLISTSSGRNPLSTYRTVYLHISLMWVVGLV